MSPYEEGIFEVTKKMVEWEIHRLSEYSCQSKVDLSVINNPLLWFQQLLLLVIQREGNSQCQNVVLRSFVIYLVNHVVIMEV